MKFLGIQGNRIYISKPGSWYAQTQSIRCDNLASPTLGKGRSHENGFRYNPCSIYVCTMRLGLHDARSEHPPLFVNPNLVLGWKSLTPLTFQKSGPTDQQRLLEVC